MSHLTRIADAISSTLFTIHPKLSAGRLPRAFRLLVKLIEREEDTNWEYGAESHASLCDLITGAYWFYVNNHGGQWSEEYSAQCALSRIYSPGPCANGPGSDTAEEYVYNALSEIA